MDTTENVLLNVSGKLYQIHENIKCKLPLSQKSQLISYNGTDQVEYVYYKNRELFERVINFFGGSSLHIPNSMCPVEFEEELEFWKIEPKELSPCCYIKYKQRENAKAMINKFLTHRRKKFDKDQSRIQLNKPYLHQLRIAVWNIIEFNTKCTLSKVYLIVSAFFILSAVFGISLSTLPVFREKSVNLIGNNNKPLRQSADVTTQTHNSPLQISDEITTQTHKEPPPLFPLSDYKEQLPISDDSTTQTHKGGLSISDDSTPQKHKGRLSISDDSTTQSYKERLPISYDSTTQTHKGGLRISDDSTTQTHKERLRISDDSTTQTHKERLRISDDSTTQTHKERLPISDDSTTQTHKERLPVSDDSTTQTHKERLPVSENSNAQAHKERLLFPDDSTTQTHKERLPISDDSTTQTHKERLPVSENSTIQTHKDRLLLPDDSTTQTHKERLPISDDSTTQTHKERTPMSDDSTTQTHKKRLPISDDSTPQTHKERLLESDDSTTQTHKERLPISDDSTTETHKGRLLASDDSTTQTYIIDDFVLNITHEINRDIVHQSFLPGKISSKFQSFNSNTEENFISALYYMTNSFFLLDVLCRVVCSPNLKAIITDILIMFDIFVTLCAIVWYTLQIYDYHLDYLLYVQIFRVLGLFRILQHIHAFKVLGYTLNFSKRDLLALMMYVCVVIIIMSNFLYFVENTNEFTSIPETWWYTVVTMTTLGYGDMVPTTVIGKIIGALSVIIGFLLFSLIIPIMASRFMTLYDMTDIDDYNLDENEAKEECLTLKSV